MLWKTKPFYKFHINCGKLNYFINSIFIVKNQTILIVHCGKLNYFINSILIVKNQTIL